MKNLKTLLFTAVLFIGATSFTSAQGKIAHINKQELIKAMPEYAVAQAEIEKLGKTYEAEIQGSYKELDAKYKQYNAEAETKTYSYWQSAASFQSCLWPGLHHPPSLRGDEDRLFQSFWIPFHSLIFLVNRQSNLYRCAGTDF